jgi:hypothetical protein
MWLAPRGSRSDHLVAHPSSRVRAPGATRWCALHRLQVLAERHDARRDVEVRAFRPLIERLLQAVLMFCPAGRLPIRSACSRCSAVRSARSFRLVSCITFPLCLISV